MEPFRAVAAFVWHSQPSFDRSLLNKRQAGGQSGTTAVPSPSPSNNQGGGGGYIAGQGQAPLTVYTFIIAIALFVLVVSFVLLRIFVRNRRLRALGLYPESPIERLLGGAPREYEDNLPPPKLWDAKIADVRANNSGAMARAEKSMLGGGVGAGDVQEYGWDALMPVSAALPPNLYPVIFQHDHVNAANSSAGANATSTDANSASAAGAHPSRLTRHMPRIFRPRSASGTDAATATTTTPAAGPADAAKADTQTDAAAAGAAAIGEEKLASSVNVTVLIAMPSPKTVFPTTRRTMHARSTSRLNGSGILAVAPENSKLEEVNETADADSSSDKGKARRAPSLHSIRTTASAKSQGEARREAFFGAQTEDAPLPSVDPRPYDDEEDELPELVFGTASVPLYSKIAGDDTSNRSMFATAPRRPMSLIPPTRDELLALMAVASDARTQKPKPKQKDKSKSDDDGDAAMTAGGAAAVRQSVAGTSMEGTRGAEDHSASGDILMQSNRGIVEEYEMGSLSRPSMGGIGGNASFVGDETRNTQGSRLSMANSVLLSSGAPMGVDDEATSTTDSAPRRAGATDPSMTSAAAHSSTSALSGAMSAHTAREGGSSPTNTQTDRQSFTTWHTGDDNDDVAHLAAHAINFDPPTTPAAAASRSADGGARV